MDCFGTYFTHVQTCDSVRVQSATQWTASSPTSAQGNQRVFLGWILPAILLGLLALVFCPQHLSAIALLLLQLTLASLDIAVSGELADLL